MNGVGNRLKREEIIESLIEPNAKLDPKFITTNLETKSGDAFTGFVVAEDATSVTLRIGGGSNQKIAKADLAKREDLKQSSMPEGLGGTMSPGEFLDVVEYLSNLK